MSVRFRSLTAGTALALASVTAFAAGDHDHAHDHKPLHGGVVTEVRDVDYELVVQQRNSTCATTASRSM